MKLAPVILATAPGLITGFLCPAAELTGPPQVGPVETLPLDQVSPGMRATAWTVFQGTTPEPVPVEIIGLGAKIFALAMRLFANMIAGHILLAVLAGFVYATYKVSVIGGVLVGIPVVLGSVAITLLEVFVAFLQAFIFTFLTCLFLGQSIVFHHDEHEHAPEGAH